MTTAKLVITPVSYATLLQTQRRLEDCASARGIRASPVLIDLPRNRLVTAVMGERRAIAGFGRHVQRLCPNQNVEIELVRPEGRHAVIEPHFEVIADTDHAVGGVGD